MKKAALRKLLKEREIKEYRNPYVEESVVKDELVIDKDGNKKIKRTVTKEEKTKKKKGDK